jgi:transcription elongation factor Elf1
MREISRSATFSPSDGTPRILQDLGCPGCGHEDPTLVKRSIIDNKVHIFCDSCGAFVTILLDDEQSDTIRRRCS